MNTLTRRRAAFFLALLALSTSPVLAVEYISNEQPLPSSVAESQTPIQTSFQPAPIEEGLWKSLKQKLSDQTPFLRDTQLGVHLRTYEVYQDNGKDAYQQAWTLGGDLSYKSGWIMNRLAFGSVLYTSQPLYAPEDKDDTDLLKPDQREITVVGQLYAQVKVASQTLVNLYRTAYDTPYINKNDSRMVPNTFEGYTVLGNWHGPMNIGYGGGYIDRIKERDSDRFIWMSQAAGASVNRGVFAGGINASGSGFSFGGLDYYSQDLINIAYAESKGIWSGWNGVGLSLSTQFTHQQSVGEDLLTGSAFHTNQVGLQTQASYAGGFLTLAYTNNANGSTLQNPWGGYPGYTSVQINSFNLAGEQALLTGLSYDLKHLGWPGGKAGVLFVHGWSAVNPGSDQAAAQQNEVDMDVQWQPRYISIKNLWLRLRYANAGNYGVNTTTTNEIRFIANYKFSAL